MTSNGHRADPVSLTWSEFKRRRSETLASEWVVDRLIPKPALGLMVGDSSIGKTPLAIQMALAVSAGIRFLGQPTTRQTVIIADLESGPDLFESIVEAQCRFLGLPAPPPEFRSLVSTEGIESVEALEIEIAAARPGMVIVDSLRAWLPGTERDAETAGKVLNQLKAVSRRHSCAANIIHHPRKAKSDEDGKIIRPLLRDSSVSDWMTNAAGSRALINLADVRIGIDAARAKGPTGDLTIKWNLRVLGDSGTYFINRIHDTDTGEPLGYQLATGRDQLSSFVQDFYDKLPEECSYKRARMIYGRGDSSTVYALRQMISAGVIIHDKAAGLYKRVNPDTA